MVLARVDICGSGSSLASSISFSLDMWALESQSFDGIFGVKYMVQICE